MDPVRPSSGRKATATGRRAIRRITWACTPGYIKRADVAWYCSHHHTAEGLNQPYAYSYLFAYPLDLPAGAKTLMLPNNDRIKVLAVSVAQEGPTVKPAHPLYDTLGGESPKMTVQR